MNDINTDIERKLKRSKCFFYFGIGMLMLSMLLMGYAIGTFTTASRHSSAEVDNQKELVDGNVFVSGSPGSRRYHLSRDCPALRRSNGSVTETSVATAEANGKTLCGWCGK